MLRSVTVVLLLFLSITGVALAEERPWTVRSRLGFRSGAPLARHYFYPFAAYSVPYPTPVVVISPYGSTSYLHPFVVTTSPYFFVFRNDGFVSRISLLDHLSGTHKIPFAAARTICPDAVASCLFPSY